MVPGAGTAEPVKWSRKFFWNPTPEGSVPMDQALASMLDRAIEQAGFPAHRLTSGAGHDAMVVASRMPSAMMFLRCQNGISHHPAENVREDDVAAALDAGVKFLDEMARVSRG